MGVCLGWTQSRDIDAAQWAMICADFQKLAPAFDAELAARELRMSSLRTLPWSLFHSPPPVPAYDVRIVNHNTISVSPSAPPPSMENLFGQPMYIQTPWEIHRAAGEYWNKMSASPTGVYQSEALMATLLLVEHHAPGVLLITQNDYEAGVWEEARAWASPAVGHLLTAPAHESQRRPRSRTAKR